ncbi:MAG: hypothetical protein L0154_18915 [Chloroflexi bacterium]|nr:hypothetical protein [Chloroflexota bacterium]
MWRTAVLFGSSLILFVGGLFLVRQETPVDNLIVFLGNDSLYRMTANGEALRQITAHEVEEFVVSPDGHSIATVERDGEFYNVNQLNIDGSSRTLLVEDIRPRWPIWSPDGSRLAYIGFEKDVPTLMSLHIETGQRESMIDERTSLLQPVWSGNRLAVQTSASQGWRLTVVDTDSRETTPVVIVQANSNVSPALSPDGEWLAFAATFAFQPDGVNQPVFLTDNNLHAVYHDGRALRLITVGLNVDNTIFWTSEWLVFSARSATAPRTLESIYKVRPDGSRLTLLTDGDLNIYATDVSPDEHWILAEVRSSFAANGPVKLLRISMDGSTVEEISTPFNRVQNAQWIAPVNLHWNPLILLLMVVIGGGLYAAYRRFI